MTAQAGDTPLLKQTLRRQLRAQRLRLPRSQARRCAKQAARHALRALLRRRARRVALYLAYGSELSTAPLIALLRRHRIAIALPCIDGPGRMHFEAWPAQRRLRPRHHGIDAPVGRGERWPAQRIDAVVMPLLGFDRHGTRLGAGGGYYDRYFAAQRALPRPWRLGYAYAFQQCDRLPRDPWDVRLDGVITEQGCLWRTG